MCPQNLSKVPHSCLTHMATCLLLAVPSSWKQPWIRTSAQLINKHKFRTPSHYSNPWQCQGIPTSHQEHFQTRSWSRNTSPCAPAHCPAAWEHKFLFLLVFRRQVLNPSFIPLKRDTKVASQITNLGSMWKSYPHDFCSPPSTQISSIFWSLMPQTNIQLLIMLQ